MGFFRYTAIDSSGKQMDGTISAADSAEAVRSLSGRGFRNVRVQSPDAAPQQTQLIRTGKASDSQLFYFFSQAASLTKAGINPHEAFHSIASRTSNRYLQRASEEISSASIEGGTISGVMAKYVDLFPHNAVGMVRAGEFGGFLPQALDQLAQHFSESASFKRWFWFLKLLSWQGLIAVALSLPLPSAFWAGLRIGTSTGFLIAYSKFLLFPTLPIMGVLFVIYLLVRLRIARTEETIRRHKFVLKLPWGLGARAKAESLTTFLWTLRNLSRSGIAPGTAWMLASGSVPNAAMAMQLAEAGKVRGGERPLSENFNEANLFPPDIVSLMQVGEHAGDVVGTLDQMVEGSFNEFLIEKARSRVGLASIGCLAVLISAGIMALVLAQGYYGRVFQEAEDFVNSP